MSAGEILVVDDEGNIAELFAHMLRLEGYTVHLAFSVESALPTLTQFRMDIVLTDPMMPRLDGADLLRTMRGNPRLANIPVLVMSGLPEETVRRCCRGIAGFLLNPFRLEDLIGAVDSLLSRAAAPVPAVPDQPLDAKQHHRLPFFDTARLVERLQLLYWEGVVLVLSREDQADSGEVPRAATQGIAGPHFS